MNGTYPISVYTWNHYDGEEPAMNSIGLPLEFASADLPTSIPEHVGMTISDMSENDQLSYSPGLMEMPVTEAQEPVAVAVSQPQPGLWGAVKNAIKGGSLQTANTNSTTSVTNGTNSTLKT